MKVSIVIPCYNFENYIEQSILSAVSQKTNFEFEILVRDDFSTDNSQSIIDRVANFNTNVKVFKPDENWGAQRNITFLMEQSKGDYIAYLDGDDYWTDVCKLQKQIDYMDSDPECIMTFAGYFMRDNSNYTPELTYQWYCLPQHLNSEIKIEDLLNGNWGTFGRVFRNVKIDYKEEEMQTIYFDWVTNYELSKMGKIKYLNFPCGVYRVHDDGIFSNQNMEYKEEKADIVREFLKRDYDEYRNEIKSE